LANRRLLETDLRWEAYPKKYFEFNLNFLTGNSLPSPVVNYGIKNGIAVLKRLL